MIIVHAGSLALLMVGTAAAIGSFAVHPVAAVAAAGPGTPGAPEVLRPRLVPLTPEEQSVKTALLRLVRVEDEAILSGDGAKLRAVFEPPSEARDAYRNARKRRDFLVAWMAARGVAISAVRVTVRTPRIVPSGPSRVRISAVVSERYMYRYRGDSRDRAFGLGIRHEYVLAKDRRNWYIRSDDFTDPLDQDTRVPITARPASGAAPPRNSASHGTSTGARQARAYADRFCGAAPGCGNGGFYNPAYRSFNGDGGDCTNFISQALKAGGFRETHEWAYDPGAAEGSRSWANARGFFDFLEASGRATIAAHGRYPDVHRAVANLAPGDLVSYIERGKAVHTSVIVGFDTHGVALVDSHTSDRYQVPWDLGWDRSTYYYFWHVHYPKPAAKPSPAHRPVATPSSYGSAREPPADGALSVS